MPPATRRWFKALRCKDKSVLETLVAHTKSGARAAAHTTLETQTEGTSIATSLVVGQMSVENALKSSAALSPFINRTAKDALSFVAVSVRANAIPGLAVCVARVPNGARSAALHACSRPPPAARPPAASGMGVLWSVAAHELSPRTDQAKVVPGVLERHGLMHRLRMEGETRASGPFRGGFTPTVQRCADGYDRYIRDETCRALPSAAGGMTRSFIGIQALLSCHEGVWHAANRLYDEAKDLANQTGAMDLSTRETATRTAEIMGTSCRPERRVEPLCTPATGLAKGFQLNELLRRAMQTRTRKNEPCKLLLGVHTNSEVNRDMPPVMDTEPMPLCTICDFGLRVPSEVGRTLHPGIPDHAPHPRVQSCPVKMSLHVCLDGAIRATELIALLDGEIHKQRALLYVGSSQASFISEAGTALSAAQANANINSSKKIQVRAHSNPHTANALTSCIEPHHSVLTCFRLPCRQCADMNTIALLSIYDVWGGGINNVHRSFAGTPWSGAYGPLVQHGLTSAGLMGHFFRSDGRGHGSHTLSPECADEIAARISSETHWVPIGPKKYAQVPVACRGIPHGFVPGVHTVLDDYVRALEQAYRQAGREETPWTKLGLFSLPFSGVTQALRPDVESTADSTLRHCFRAPEEISCATGRSYLPDATHEDDAIFREPLWRRPCQASVGDNPFATSYEYADSVWNVMNALSVVAERRGGVPQLRELIDDFHFASEATPARFEATGGYLWAADACVLLFGALYPRSHAIARKVVPECYATAHGCLNVVCNPKTRAAGEATLDHPLHRCWPDGASSEVGKRLQEEALATWTPFSSRSGRPPHLCPWLVGVAPMLELLLKHKGSHDLSSEDRAELREAVNTLASRAAWLAYSEDGVKPPRNAATEPAHPLSECAGPGDVRRPHLDPIFCAQGEQLEIEPRGCLVGLKPFQLRQLYALLLGSHLMTPDVDPEHPGVQVVRNEGARKMHHRTLPAPT